MAKKIASEKTKLIPHNHRIFFTVQELEAAYVLCSSGTYKKPRTQTRVVNKIREVLLDAVLKR